MGDEASKSSAIERGFDYVDKGIFEDELRASVAFHTESQRPESVPELERYIDELMIPAFTAMGFECTVYPNQFEGCGPFLLATRHESDDYPTVLG